MPYRTDLTCSEHNGESQTHSRCRQNCSSERESAPRILPVVVAKCSASNGGSKTAIAHRCETLRASFPLSSNASSGHGQAQEAEQVRRAEEARSAGKKQLEASDCASASAASTPSPEELSGHTPREPVVASAKPAAGRSAKGGKVGSYFERFKCLEQIFTWFSGREHDDEVPSCLLVSVYSCFRCLYYWGRAGRQPA